MKTVWYIDDENVKHYTVIYHKAELIFLKYRFDFVGIVEDFV